MTYSAVNTIWVLLGAALVFFMQAGFSMCEAGFTRAKNTGNILMKNLMDFCIGTPCFWLFGFGLMFGTGCSLFGRIDPMILGDYSAVLPRGVPLWAFAIFQTVFCATSATIVSGSMAERTKFSAYCLYSAAISLLIYPVSGHWIWGGGWLSQLGFHDFAGSACVHMVGGVCALIGAKMLGPRIGKYDKNGKPKAILGHNLTFAALGVFILWFCWFGFNGASTLGMDSDGLLLSAGLVFFNTNLCAATACCAALIFTWLRYGKPDVSMTYNAALAGASATAAAAPLARYFPEVRSTPPTQTLTVFSASAAVGNRVRSIQRQSRTPKKRFIFMGSVLLIVGLAPVLSKLLSPRARLPANRVYINQYTFLAAETQPLFPARGENAPRLFPKTVKLRLPPRTRKSPRPHREAGERGKRHRIRRDFAPSCSYIVHKFAPKNLSGISKLSKRRVFSIDRGKPALYNAINEND